MNNRRRKNQRLLGEPELPEQPTIHLPSKTDLLGLLERIKNRATPDVSAAIVNYEATKQAREEFQRTSKEWMRLRKAEKAAEKALKRTRDSERERLNTEISGCLDDLLLNGVTSDLVDRIRRLFNLDDDF